MKKLSLILVGAAFLATAGGLSSQTTPAAPKTAPGAPRTAPATPGKPAVDPMALLKQIKSDNAILLERQDTVLKALDVLGEEARQVRIFAKRG